MTAKELLDKHLVLKGVQKTLIVNGAVYLACKNAIDEALTIPVYNCSSCGTKINYEVICDVCSCKGNEAYKGNCNNH